MLKDKSLSWFVILVLQDCKEHVADKSQTNPSPNKSIANKVAGSTCQLVMPGGSAADRASATWRWPQAGCDPLWSIVIPDMRYPWVKWYNCQTHPDLPVFSRPGSCIFNECFNGQEVNTGAILVWTGSELRDVPGLHRIDRVAMAREGHLGIGLCHWKEAVWGGGTWDQGTVAHINNRVYGVDYDMS